MNEFIQINSAELKGLHCVWASAGPHGSCKLGSGVLHPHLHPQLRGAAPWLWSDACQYRTQDQWWTEPKGGIFPYFSYFWMDCFCLLSLIYFILSSPLLKATIYFSKSPKAAYLHKYVINEHVWSASALTSSSARFYSERAPSIKCNSGHSAKQG